LYGTGLEITFVGFNLHNWTNDIENTLNEELKGIHFHYIESTKAEFFPWIFSSLIEKLSRFICLLLSPGPWLASMAISKRTWLLMKWAKRWNGHADLIVAHNPPSFFVAAMLANKNHSAFAIDMEDYHAGEGQNKNIGFSSAVLMKTFIPKTIYTSFASPLIMEYTEKLIGENDYSKYIVLNNVFSNSEFLDPVSTAPSNNKIGLVWFSQFIDYGRGLEKLFLVLDGLEDVFNLTLIGNLREPFFKNELERRQYINCVPSLSQIQLHRKLADYDIGLALEDPDADVNRNICLTNKIWSYFQAGLYIVASDTDAQKSFLQNFRYHGICISLTGNFHKSFENLALNIESIRAGRGNRFKDAAPFSWDHEQKKLLDVFGMGLGRQIIR
jgi:hypothetical protein